MEYINKIKDKKELFNEDGTLISLNLMNVDLSDLDLSDVDPSVWKSARFYHTNLKNTGIKFYPRKLMRSDIFDFYSLEFCDLENCDLSYLSDEDMKAVILRGANLKNTNLQIDFRNNKVFSQAYNPYFIVGRQSDEERVDLRNGTILPSWYDNKPIDYFDYADLDVDFLENNPNIKISSGKLLEVIANFFNHKYSKNNPPKAEEYEEYYQLFLKLLEYDYEGKLKRFYDDMKPYLTSKEKYLDFFQGKIKNVDFEELDLTYLDKKLLTIFLFKRCDISKLKLGHSYKDINKEVSKCLYVGFMDKSPIGELSIPLSIHDWQNRGKARLFNSSITMRTNLYLEFARLCNMSCEFCRNESLEGKEFDFDKIMTSLKKIYLHLNTIVIGGGEPTLYSKELKELSKILKNIKARRRISKYVITNGSLDYEEYNSLNYFSNYNYYFSRHAVEDDENQRIFGDRYHKIMTTEDLTKIDERTKHVMCCTCFKGGVDKVEKFLEYVRYVEYLGYKNILFQNLHLEDPLNVPINISEYTMLDAIDSLREKGYLVKQPIISNSNYILYLLKKDDFTISFKIYKPFATILDLWNKSPKRCFDLSIDPSGELHETWKESNEINILQRKNQL